MADFITKDSIKLVSVLFVIISFIAFVILYHRNNKEIDLQQLVAVSLTSSFIPTGFVLVLCAIDMDLITNLEDFSIYIAIGGLALLHVSISSIRSLFIMINKKPKI